MKIFKNTSTLDGYDDGLVFVKSKEAAEIALLGSKSINLNEFPNLKGIFRVGVGRDNIPEAEAKKKGIIIQLPSQGTTNIIFNETASFTCGLIFRMLYLNVGDINSWFKEPREQLKSKTLLIIGSGQIGSRVAKLMDPFLNIIIFDILKNNINELKEMIEQTDCISIHIPNTKDNHSFIDREKLSWMKNDSILINTARGPIVDEDSMYSELKNGRLKAAFDVFWEEPYNGRLKEFYPDRFYMTPHVSSTCRQFLEGCRKDLNILIDNLGHK